MSNYNFDKKRFEAFIDAILAIILTILVLEFKIPESENSDMISTKQQLVSLLPSFISYVGSFLLIVGLWIDHHVLFLNINKITKPFILLNMMVILSLSILPFTTSFAGTHPSDSFAVSLLFTNYSVMNVLFGFLYGYSSFKKHVTDEFIKENKKVAIYSYVGIIGLIIAIPIAYINTYASFALGIIIFTGHLFKPIKPSNLKQSN